MRDKRFIAEHRGGPLTREQHNLLTRWACICVEHVLPLMRTELDDEVIDALVVARAWVEGNASVGAARNASVALLALARRQSDPLTIAIIRAAGHAVATAHMADHSMKAAAYALQAIRYVKKAADSERAWQLEQLPESIRGLIETP